ncbi:MAG TPA: cyclic nucleotide-binding domain-containing protein, partial [Candidatus Angelobacter sp.]|nr:cyclic nucleotide-binding domain-containing protein [Candidatus Angelobacter sp.]
MAEKSELKRIPVFIDLPDDQISWFLGQTHELVLKPDDFYIHQGDPADAMFVILEGQLQARGELAGEIVTITTKAGDITGILPYSRMKQFPLTGRAITASRILKFPAALFPELIKKMPELTGRLVGLMSDRIRETTRIEQQRDRLVGLGKLSAGLAHELNNPASAAKRASSQLRKIIKAIKDASHSLGARELTTAQKGQIENLEASLIQQDGPPP